jgi:predicted amidohydrolase YtcJ
VRIEHAQIVDLSDIPRFARLDVVASMQPTHCTSDMPWAPVRLGEARLRGAYAWRRFARQRVILASGSDFPVESHDPRLGLYAAATRHSLLTQESWSPEERLSREEALVSFTAAPAYVSGDLSRWGTLTPGKSADCVVWDRNLITCDVEALPQAQVLCTLIGGTVVYQQEAYNQGGPGR